MPHEGSTDRQSRKHTDDEDGGKEPLKQIVFATQNNHRDVERGQQNNHAHCQRDHGMLGCKLCSHYLFFLSNVRTLAEARLRADSEECVVGISYFSFFFIGCTLSP